MWIKFALKYQSEKLRKDDWRQTQFAFFSKPKRLEKIISVSMKAKCSQI